MSPRTAILAAALSFSLFACRSRDAARALPDPSRRATPAGEAVPAPPPAPPPRPAVVERVLVPGDSPASVVFGPNGAPPRAVFLPGVCSNALGYLQSFQTAARDHGGIVAIDGDAPCPGGGPAFHTFTWDARRQHARIEAALAAAGVKEIDRAGLTVVGYSQGAAIAEQLVARWPDRYTRTVLIGSPQDPSAASLLAAAGVVTMSCSLDVTWRMKGAAAVLSRRGTPATYLEMPGCRHGGVAEAERVFGEAFDWLDANARAPREAARAVPIVGRAES